MAALARGGPGPGLFAPRPALNLPRVQELISLLVQGFLCPNTTPNPGHTVARILLSFFFNSLDLFFFFTATQSLQSIYLLTVLFYKYFPNSDKVKSFYRSAPKSLPNRWVLQSSEVQVRIRTYDIPGNDGYLEVQRLQRPICPQQGLIIPIH